MPLKSNAVGIYKEAKIAKLARPVRAKLATFFRHQRVLLLRELDKHKAAFEVPSDKYPEVFHVDEYDFIWDDIEDETTDDLQNIVVSAEIKGMEAGVGFNGKMFPFGQVFDLENPRAIEWFAKHGGSVDYIKGIQETTKNQIKTLVTQTVKEGDSYSNLAKKIRTKFDGFSKERAKLISVHELGQAFEGGNRLAVDDLADLGMTFEKRANSMRDGLVSPMCVENDEKGWIPKDESFPSGHQNSPFHIRCRCWTEYRRS